MEVTNSGGVSANATRAVIVADAGSVQMNQTLPSAVSSLEAARAEAAAFPSSAAGAALRASVSAGFASAAPGAVLCAPDDVRIVGVTASAGGSGGGAATFSLLVQLNVTFYINSAAGAGGARRQRRELLATTVTGNPRIDSLTSQLSALLGQVTVTVSTTTRRPPPPRPAPPPPPLSSGAPPTSGAQAPAQPPPASAPAAVPPPASNNAAEARNSMMEQLLGAVTMFVAVTQARAAAAGGSACASAVQSRAAHRHPNRSGYAASHLNQRRVPLLTLFLSLSLLSPLLFFPQPAVAIATPRVIAPLTLADIDQKSLLTTLTNVNASTAGSRVRVNEGTLQVQSSLEGPGDGGGGSRGAAEELAALSALAASGFANETASEEELRRGVEQMIANIRSSTTLLVRRFHQSMLLDLKFSPKSAFTHR